MALRPAEQVRRLREGGHVRRCHALLHNDHGYTDGKHSFDAATLLLVLHPDPSINLVKAVLWHDMGERWVGDLPASAKWASPELSGAYNTLEQTVLRDILGLGPLFDSLSDNDKQWLVAVDCLEFWMWCLDQLALGNTSIRTARHNIEQAIDKRIRELLVPVECSTFYARYDHHRTPERLDDPYYKLESPHER